VVTLWGTGFGSTGPPCATGGFNDPGPVNLAFGISVMLNDYQFFGDLTTGRSNPALYAGSAPALLCGVVQINMLVPTYAEPGAFLFFPEAVKSGLGGFTRNQSTVGVTIAVK
jgi:uncharacterized protein (TIGR03437 family)